TGPMPCMGVAGLAGARGGARPGGTRRAARHVPGGQLPAALAGQLGELALGLVGLLGQDPQAGERGVDIIGQLLGQVHHLGPSIESGRENRKARRRRNSDTCLRAVGVVVGQGYCWICCWTGAVWWYSAVVWSVVVTPSARSRNRL